MLPKQFQFLPEIAGSITVYECSVILVDLWRYFQATAPNAAADLDHAFMIQPRGTAANFAIDCLPYMENLRLILQANIAVLGDIYRRIFIDSVS